MKITAVANFSDNKSYNYLLGSVDRDYVYIGSITLERNGDGGQISEAQAKAILAEAIQVGAEITINFGNVRIVLE